MSYNINNIKTWNDIHKKKKKFLSQFHSMIFCRRSCLGPTGDLEILAILRQTCVYCLDDDLSD